MARLGWVLTGGSWAFPGALAVTALAAVLAAAQPASPTPPDLLVAKLAVDSAADDVPPIEVSLEGNRLFAVYDRFRLIWLAAREARRIGQQVDPADLPVQVRAPRVVVLTYPRSPTTGDTVNPQWVQLNGQTGRVIAPADAKVLLPGVELPPLTRVVAFDVTRLTPGDKLAITYNDPSDARGNGRAARGSIPGMLNATVAAVLPVQVKADSPVLPPGFQMTSPEVDVHVEGILDLAGHIRYPRALDGSPELRAAAVDALKTWEYKPARMFNTPVPAVLQGVVTFKQ